MKSCQRSSPMIASVCLALLLFSGTSEASRYEISYFGINIGLTGFIDLVDNPEGVYQGSSAFRTAVVDDYEIRVAGLMKQVEFDRDIPGRDAMPAHEVLRQINLQCHEAYERQYQIYNDILLPLLEQEDIRFLRATDWSEEQAN